MATEPVSLPQNNSLQALGRLVEERKREVGDRFLELRAALQQCEEGVAGGLERLYSDTRESVESSERTVLQLEEAKNGFQATLVDNKMNAFLQTTIQNIDAQIAEVRNSTALVPKHIQLEWRRDAKQYILTLCKVISSTDDTSCGTGAPEPIPQPAQNIETETVQCKQQEAPEREHAPKSGSSSRKQSVLLAWIRQVQTGERDEVMPFSVPRHEGKQTQVVLKTVGADAPKAVPDRAKGQVVADSYSQPGISKQTLRELEKCRTEIELLKQRHATETAELLKREEKHKQTISELKDVDRVRQLEQQLSDKNKENTTLKAYIEEKNAENKVLRENLDNSMKELEMTKLEFYKLSAQSKLDSKHQSADCYASKPPTQEINFKAKPSPRAAINPIQHKYKITKIYFNGKWANFHVLSQVEKPEELVGELALCKSKLGDNHIVGTIKVIIPRKYNYEKIIAGIEFLDPLGDSNGEYEFRKYFKTEKKHAMFLPISEVYISHPEQKLSDI